MKNKFSNSVIKLSSSMVFWHEQLKQKVLSQGKEKSVYRKNESILLLQLSLLFLIAAMLYPHLSFAYGSSSIEDIATIKELSKKVQDEIQGNGVSLMLNAAGIVTAFFALVTSRWMMLFFGAAYLVFVNVFFGFVNGSFKIK